MNNRSDRRADFVIKIVKTTLGEEIDWLCRFLLTFQINIYQVLANMCYPFWWQVNWVAYWRFKGVQRVSNKFRRNVRRILRWVGVYTHDYNTKTTPGIHTYRYTINGVRGSLTETCELFAKLYFNWWMCMNVAISTMAASAACHEGNRKWIVSERGWMSKCYLSELYRV